MTIVSLTEHLETRLRHQEELGDEELRVVLGRHFGLSGPLVWDELWEAMGS